MEEEEFGYGSVVRYFIGAALFMLGMFASLLLRELNLNIFGIRSWGIFLFIPAIIFAINGIRQIHNNKKIEKALLNSIYNRGYGKIYLNDLSEEINLDSGIILNVLSVLRKNGKIAYQFDSNMDEITILSMS